MLRRRRTSKKESRLANESQTAQHMNCNRNQLQLYVTKASKSRHMGPLSHVGMYFKKCGIAIITSVYILSLAPTKKTHMVSYRLVVYERYRTVIVCVCLQRVDFFVCFFCCWVD
jgi:hypothetical protein